MLRKIKNKLKRCCLVVFFLKERNLVEHDTAAGLFNYSWRGLNWPGTSGGVWGPTPTKLYVVIRWDTFKLTKKQAWELAPTTTQD